MPEASCSGELRGQNRIWAHFQRAAPEAFDAARPRLDFLVRQIGRRLPVERPVVLDIGIGNGYFERRAVARGWEVHALDPDAATVEGLVRELGVAGHVGGIEEIPLASESCDCVVASEVLEHLTEAQGSRAVAEVARVLRAGGVFLGTVPYEERLADAETICPRCGERFHRWGHERSFTAESLRRMLAEGFAVEVVRRTAFPPMRGQGPAGMAKSLIRIMLAKWGERIAVPSLYYRAVKTR